MAIADSEDSLENIDLVIPANNKAGSSIATVYFLLACEIARETDLDFDMELEDFKPEEEEE